MIRPATAGDAAQIRAIWNPIIRDTAITFDSVEKTDADTAALIAGKTAALVAELDGRLAGFAHYGQFRGGVGYARTMEHTVILSPAAQGRGIGRVLVGRLADHARDRGARWLIAGVSGENGPGLAFHAALGFRPLAVLPEAGFKFGRYMDLHLMGLAL